jgi:hypothetical protein
MAATDAGATLGGTRLELESYPRIHAGTLGARSFFSPSGPAVNNASVVANQRRRGPGDPAPILAPRKAFIIFAHPPTRP